MSKPTDAIRRILQLRVFLIVNVVVLLFLLLSFGRQWVRNASIENEIMDLSRQKEALEVRNTELLSLGQTIQTQYYLEKEGRLKYGLSKPGEQLIVITDQKSTEAFAGNSEGTEVSATGAEVTTADAPARVGNPKRWWAYFFDSESYQAMQNEYGS